MPAIDIVTVFHNAKNRQQAADLAMALNGMDVSFFAVDNTRLNRGFGPGCNAGASQGHAPIIGFLNPDVTVSGDFVDDVVETLVDPIVITGERFGKPQRELQQWGVNDWVCGAAFFVDREWFESRGGFDPQYKWGWEETDLIRQAQACGKRVKSISLPIHHASPDIDTPKDVKYKNYWFNKGNQIYYRKWGRTRAR